MEFHIVTLRFLDNRALAPDDAGRLYLARLVSSVGRGSGLLAWRAEGATCHLLLRAGRQAAGQVARRIEIGAQQVLGGRRAQRPPTRFHRAQIQPVPRVEEAREVAVFLLGDGDPEDPLHLASNLPDILDLREIGAYTRERLLELPGFTLQRVVESMPEPPSQGEELPLELDWAELASATAAVFGHERLDQRVGWRGRAVAAAVLVAAPRLGISGTARALGLSRATVHRAMERPRERSLSRAVRRQLSMRSQLRAGKAGDSLGG